MYCYYHILPRNYHNKVYLCACKSHLTEENKKMDGLGETKPEANPNHTRVLRMTERKRKTEPRQGIGLGMIERM